MTARSDPRLFAHLLERTGWMRSLARELCADHAVADDIVQDAWLAALEHPPRDTGAARAWLGRVIANLTHARQRSESARSARQEFVARGEAVSSTADVVERAEIGKRLAECVLALDEPYRSTVLWRYFDGLSAEEIGAREHVSSSTVRTRLARGLALLRERLERRDGRTWMSALALLARARTGATAAGTATASTIASTQAAPVIVMSTLAKIGIGAALVAAATWIAWPTPEQPEQVAAPVEPVREPPRSPTGDVADASQRAAVPSSRPLSTPQTAAATPADTSEPSTKEIDALMVEIPPATIEGVVFRGHNPVARCDVYAWPSWSPLPEHPKRGPPNAKTDAPWDDLIHTTTDAHGLFRFDRVHTDPYPGFRYMVGVDDGDGVRAETAVQPLADHPGTRIVILLGSARVRGHVYDDDGKPRAGARVTLSLNAPRLSIMRGFYTSRSTDANGAFEISELAGGTYYLDAYLEGRPSWATQPDLTQKIMPVIRAGEARTIDVGSPRRSARWTGTIRTRSGAFVPGPFKLSLQNRATLVRFESNYDDQGRFQIPLRPGTYDVAVRLVGRYGEVKVDPLTIHAADLERDIVVSGTRVKVSAIDTETGMPWSPSAPRVEVSMHLDGHNYPDAVLSNDIRADGSCVIDGLTAGEWVLSARFVRITSNDRLAVPSAHPFDPVRLIVLDTDDEVPVRIALHVP